MYKNIYKFAYGKAHNKYLENVFRVYTFYAKESDPKL